MELEIIMLSKTSQGQKAKYACSHSFVKPRSKMMMMINNNNNGT
jgi:hypothetical protein